MTKIITPQLFNDKFCVLLPNGKWLCCLCGSEIKNKNGHCSNQHKKLYDYMFSLLKQPQQEERITYTISSLLDVIEIKTQLEIQMKEKEIEMKEKKEDTKQIKRPPNMKEEKELKSVKKENEKEKKLSKVNHEQISQINKQYDVMISGGKVIPVPLYNEEQ